MKQESLDGFRKATPEEVRAVQLEILADILDFCKKENIQVFMAFGSLLGAVRHQGYIPWDDDIDVWMFRKDYEKFIHLYNLANKDYQVASILNEPYFPFYFAKISHKNTRLFEFIDGKKHNLGINIDLFPLDNIPIDTIKGKLTLIKWHVWKKIHTIKGVVLHNKRVWYKNVIIVALNRVLKMFRVETVCTKMDLLASTFKDSQSNSVFSDGERLIFSKKLFSQINYVQFEHLKVPIPDGYDSILGQVYGEYLKLPPLNDRVTHHVYDAFIRETEVK